MKFLTLVLAAVLGTKANAQTSERPCLAACEIVEGIKECTFIVSRDQYASELGYFKFSGASGDCGGTNPTLGMEKGVTYYFIQEDFTNYYHALGFAYGADGALDDQPELEPGIKGERSTSNCEATKSCPAPMYMQGNNMLGDYNNNPSLGPLTLNKEDFGLDQYEPQFFYPLLDWLGSDTYKIALYYPDDNDFAKDFFYFCHIHQFMTGRIKFVDTTGTPLYPDDEPAIPYGYERVGSYDQSCGTSGLEDFQLPNSQCPEKFVCNQPDGAVGKFAECVDSMNCAMLVGMTTEVYNDNAIALFNHQMIPHHQNAVNMCKALLISGEADCTNLENEDDPACVTNVICQEIINVQNAQIQTMRGVLDSINSEQTADCVVQIDSAVGNAPVPVDPVRPVTPPSSKSPKKSKRKEPKNGGEKTVKVRRR